MRTAVIGLLPALVTMSVACGDDQPLTAETAPSLVTTKVPATPAGRAPSSPDVTTTNATPATVAADRDLVAVVDGWQRIDTEEARTALDFEQRGDGGWVESLPGGGFVAGSSSMLMWSPDGLNWFDGDPQRLAPPSTAAAVVGDQVILLTDDEPSLWIGDPTTGSWEPMMDLDTTGLASELLPWFVMEAGDDAVLVVGSTANDLESPLVEDGLVLWLADPVRRESTRTTLAAEGAGGGPTVWFDGRWHLMLPLMFEDLYATETGWWSSSDGVTWTEDGLSAGMQLPMLNWITAGSSGAVTCARHEGQDGAWFSSNGVDWDFVGSDVSCRGVFTDQLGFVLEGGTGFSRLSPDGTTLEDLASPFPADTVAASGNTLIVDAYRGSEFTESESAGIKGPWLYHHASGID